MLKRLNFGGNPLSTLAIEILAKTYIESPLYVGTDGGNDWSIYSPGSVRDRVHEKQMASRTGEMHESGKIKLAMEREHFRRQHGLRSVPYFILSNLELTQAAIVHLSSMVSAQMSRAYLRTFLPDTKPVVLTDEAARNCHSIIWLPNQSFDSRSRELLHCATAMVTLPPAMLQGNIRTLQTPRARSKSLVPKMRPHGAHGHLLKTVLSTALQEEGPGASDLWMTSCKMLKLRTLLLNEPSQVPSDSPRGFIRGTPEFDRQFPPLVDDHPVSSFQALVNKPVWAFWRSDFCTLVRESEYWLRLPARKQLSILTHAVGALGVLTAEQQKQVASYVGQWDVAWDEPLDKKQGQQLASFLYQMGCVYHRPQGQKMDVK